MKALVENMQDNVASGAISKNSEASDEMQIHVEHLTNHLVHV